MSLAQKLLLFCLCFFVFSIASVAIAAERVLNNPPDASGPFSQSVTAGDLIYLSGQLGIAPGQKELPRGIEAQTRQCMDNVMAALQNAGSSIDKLVKINIYLDDMDDYDMVNKIYAEYFKNGFPARTCLEVGGIPMGALIEIEAVALK